MHFKDKRIWITGASSGIGEGLAYAFAKEGAHLILSSRNEKELIRVKNNCKGNTDIIIQPLDLERYKELPEIVNKVLEKVNKIDILVNNGGISQRSMIEETEIEVDRRIMDINFMGSIQLSKLLLPHLKTIENSQIVVVSSLLGKMSIPMRSTYCASKHALHSWFEVLQMELKEQDPTITILCPGYVKTNVSFNALKGNGEKFNKMSEGQAAGLSPEEFARMALDAIRKKKSVSFFGGKEVLGVYLMRFFPKVFANIMKKREFNKL